VVEIPVWSVLEVLLPFYVISGTSLGRGVSNLSRFTAGVITSSE